MQIVEFAEITNTGRVRRNNEDSYLVQPPLFVLADGMGGAQAGEVASRLTIEAFQEAAAESAPLERLEGAIADANRRIRERSASDPATAGMGSTVTAAIVDDGCVAFGHVGDSRAYLLRRGVFQQISKDHSLVGELERQGRITQEEARVHPQRSVITRALGAADAVEIDTWRIDAEEGDLYLICSDGLTDLVDDDRLAATVRKDAPLEQLLSELVRLANDAGGDDNITVVAFRTGDTDAAAARAAAAADSAPTRGPDEDTLTEADRVPVVAAAPAQVTAVHAIPAQARILPAELDEAPRRRRSILKPLIAVLVILLLAGGAVVGAVVGLRWSHFVGVDRATGRVAVYQGVPFDLTSSHTLYRPIYTSPTLYAAQLSAAQRTRLLNHKLQSRGDALAEVHAIEDRQP